METAALKVYLRSYLFNTSLRLLYKVRTINNTSSNSFEKLCVYCIISPCSTAIMKKKFKHSEMIKKFFHFVKNGVLTNQNYKMYTNLVSFRTLVDVICTAHQVWSVLEIEYHFDVYMKPRIMKKS